LQLTLFGASDTLRSSGLTLELLKDKVAPDQFAVYSGSAISQLDPEGYGGMLQNPLIGKRPTSKNGALGLPEMPGDFINAYVLGSVGGTAGIIGACATFLYNVKQGIDDIRSGAKRVVMVGNAEAPILPDLIEAYRTMGALAEDESLMTLDGSDTPNHRRACRPFSSNSGFTVAEAAVYTLIMDDELALELGAEVLGSVADVFVNADGYKKSIPGPGVGNYLTVAKAMAVARSILGETGLRQGTYVQAHGTGTPQNRVTESHILNELAKTFHIDDWLVSAVKAYVGHSMAPAGGDQLVSVMGAWHDGWVPGITTIDHIAEDVHDSNLTLPMNHVEIDPAAMPGALINSKGFGGNNATGLFLSPQHTEQMLTKRWGKRAMAAHKKRNEAVQEARVQYDQSMLQETLSPIYRFGEGVLFGEDLTLSESAISIPGFTMPVSLDLENPYSDMV
jgi:acetoacetyl-[acyl-carrier protein] synthase